MGVYGFRPNQTITRKKHIGLGLVRNSGPADRLGAVENNQNNQPYEPYRAVLGVPVGISGKICAKCTKKI